MNKLYFLFIGLIATASVTAMEYNSDEGSKKRKLKEFEEFQQETSNDFNDLQWFLFNQIKLTKKEKKCKNQQMGQLYGFIRELGWYKIFLEQLPSSKKQKAGIDCLKNIKSTIKEQLKNVKQLEALCTLENSNLTNVKTDQASEVIESIPAFRLSILQECANSVIGSNCAFVIHMADHASENSSSVDSDEHEEED